MHNKKKMFENRTHFTVTNYLAAHIPGKLHNLCLICVTVKVVCLVVRLSKRPSARKPLRVTLKDLSVSESVSINDRLVEEGLASKKSMQSFIIKQYLKFFAVA